MSPLLRPFGPGSALRRARIPAHAFCTSDRLTARPEEAAQLPAIAAASRCWRNWHRAEITRHDGQVRPSHPIIRHALAQPQSATSLRLLLRDPLGFVWRYGLGWRGTDGEQQPLSLDKRMFGELVHELLKHAVDTLEPEPGFGRAAHHEIESAIAAAVTAAAAQWPLERSIPPLLLWQHTLDAAAALALKALTLDQAFQPGTRSWTEVRFGWAGTEKTEELPWDPAATVQVPGTEMRLRGTIDRLDLRAARDAVQVTDYKTGDQPRTPDRILFERGAEFQRVIYALAARQLLPDVPRVRARLIYLAAEPKPVPYPLADVDAAITALGDHIKTACILLEHGIALPGRDAQEAGNELRLALPAAAGSYFEIKRRAFGQALAPLARLWHSP